MIQSKIQKLIPFLLIGYIFSFSFLTIFDFPIIGTKVQPPELIFLLIIGVIGVDFLLAKKKLDRFLQLVKKLSKPFSSFSDNLIFPIILYSFTAFLSAFFHNELKVWFEFFGVMYLISLFLIFQLFKDKFSSEKIFKYFIISGIIAATLGILGWILTQFGIETPLSTSKVGYYYMYFGYIGRALAFTMNPNMLMSIIGTSFLLKFSEVVFKERPAKNDWLILFILGLVALLTLSKTLVVLTIGVIFIWMKSQEKKYRAGRQLLCPINQFTKSFILALTLSLVLFYNFGSHIAILNKKTINWDILKERAYTEEQPFYETQNFYFVWTNYVVNKKSGILAGIRNPIFGVGPGGHNVFVAGLKKEGKYPKYFSDYDPHCTYTGAFGELGFLGFLALIFLCMSIFKRVNTLLKVENHPQSFIIVGLAGSFIYFSIEAITTDIMNFRHLWVLLALLASIDVLEKRKKS